MSSKPKKKKRNQNRRPATMTVTDAEKEKKKAQLSAIDTVWTIFFTVMRRSEGYGAKRLSRIWDGVNDVSEKISKGLVSVEDLKKELAEEGFILSDLR